MPSCVLRRITTIIALTFTLGLGLAACQEYNLQGSYIEEIFYQEPASKVDILFVMDNSVSMQEEQEEVASNFQQFITSIEETNADWQIGVVTTDMVDPLHRGRLYGSIPIITPMTPSYEQAFYDNIHVGTEGHPIERGLSAALAAVTAPIASHDNIGFVRDDAQLTIITCSDENDCSDDGSIDGEDPEACHTESDTLITVPTFVTRLRAIKEDPRDVTLSAIVELGPDSPDGLCGEAATGHRYIKAAGMMGGMTRSICGEYDDIMDELGLSVAGIRSSFALVRVPDVCSIDVTVNGAIIERDDSQINGWSYDSENNYLVFWGAAVPERDTTVVVTYQPGNGDTDCIE